MNGTVVERLFVGRLSSFSTVNIKQLWSGTSKTRFDGISLIEWTKENKIKKLKEFGCNINHYNPYENSEEPQFRDNKVAWF